MSQKKKRVGECDKERKKQICEQIDGLLDSWTNRHINKEKLDRQREKERKKEREQGKLKKKERVK